MNDLLGLKIYGLTKVWPKGQIILPKECREDIHAKVGDEYELVMIDKKTFGIGIKDVPREINFTKNFRLLEPQGVIKIGTKYQFVIPSYVRRELRIEIGENLLVLWKEHGLGFLKNDDLEFFFEYLKKIFTQEPEPKK